jgi:hypothetical protein
MRKRPLENLITDEVWYKYFSNKYLELEELPEPRTYFRVSICTTSMNRLHDLKQTLIQNIKDNLDYPNLEFVLLNYNSTDDIDTWVLRECNKYIESGLLKYYKTEDPKFYSMAHSRNVAFRLATGDIVNSIDADHFTNKGFASYINTLANTTCSNTIFVKSRQRNRGRISMFKSDFLRLGGYDEEIKDYGFEDEDLLARARSLDFKIVRYGGEFCKVVPDHKIHPVNNYENKDWRYTQDRNAMLSIYNLFMGRFVANQGKEWGKALVTKNYEPQEFSSM